MGIINLIYVGGRAIFYTGCMIERIRPDAYAV
jgi:hypothetical protein